MPKIPYKSEKSRDDDDDYEIVSFEDFCDKSPGSKTDLLTLNDNINYRLCYEAENPVNFAEGDGESSSREPEKQETALNGGKNVTFRKFSGSFAPFGRSTGKTQKGSLFSGVIPKPKNDGEGSSKEHRYQRFSEERNFCRRAWDNFPGLGSGMLGMALVCALCVGVWWAVSGAVGGTWGEEHYRKLWERAHPDNIKKPLSPIPLEKVAPEYRYHDHNNLSTKNKLNMTDGTKKKSELNKKSLIEMSPEQRVTACANVSVNARFDCYPGKYSQDTNEANCEKRGCCWDASSTVGPRCFYPPDYALYRVVNVSENSHGMRVVYTLTRPSTFPGDFETVLMDVRYLADDILQVKIYDADHKRFEVPIPEIPTVASSITNLKYRVIVEIDRVGFKVIRNDDNVTVINTVDAAPLILSDKFMQISTLLPTDRVFGFGEHRTRLKRDMNWNIFTMFNKDQPPYDGTNLYGTHPFYLATEKQGKSHGMLLLNSNAIDVALQPLPALTYRTIGGVLNLVVVLGDTPAHVVSQYTAVVGRPFMPPYWALGFQLCKFGYNSMNETRRVWKANRDAGIPFDVQWNDIDYMIDHNDFTYDPVAYKGLPQFVDEVHKAGMHYVIMIDPGIGDYDTLLNGSYLPYSRGMEMDVFIKNSTNQPFIGQVWQNLTLFPDFSHPNATQYWVEMLTDLHKKLKFDGVWIDMNEISNFVKHSKCGAEDLPFHPVYMTDAGLSDKTLCMDAQHYAGTHYDVHNLHALMESVATNFGLVEIRGKRPFIISRASFPGLGHYAGHWSGDISSTWDDMRMTIPNLLSFSLFGIPMMGADICGFRGNASEQLCYRWMQLGAFYPFSRNHADIDSKPQDPVSMGPRVMDASIRALRMRYRLLPYLYTLFWRAHVYGDPVARPLFFIEPYNPVIEVENIDDEFTLGPNILVAPILEEGATHRRAYYPGREHWYNMRDGRFLATGQWNNITENEMVAVQGGSIIVLQEPPLHGPVTTTVCRSQPMQLLVVPDNHYSANGELYWDDGDSINTYEEKKYSLLEFSLQAIMRDQMHDRNRLQLELRGAVKWWGHGVPSINNVTILGQTRPPATLTVDGVPCRPPHCHYDFDDEIQSMQVLLDLPLDRHFIIVWTQEWAKGTLPFDPSKFPECIGCTGY